MPYRVSLSRLSEMSPGERKDTIDELLSASSEPTVRDMEARLRRYEMTYEMSTETMLDRWRRGELEETAEIARWLFLASAHNGDVAGQARS